MTDVTSQRNFPYRFIDLVDMPAFASMLESFYLATGIPNGVVDINGTLLCMSSGNNICHAFHRKHPSAEQLCLESNLEIMRNQREGEVAGGLCKNGLMDYATPVVIDGHRLATLFLGQVLHQEPDLNFFSDQAARFGFDKRTYLESVQAIPVISKHRIDSLMDVMVKMAQMLATNGLTRIRQSSLEQNLSEHAERRIQLEDILKFSPVAFGWTDGTQSIEYINQQFTQLFGYTLNDLPDLKTWQRLAYPDKEYRENVIKKWNTEIEQARHKGIQPPELEADITCKNGEIRRVLLRPSWVGERRLVSFSDITERWQLEQRRQARDDMLEMVAQGAELNDILNTIVAQIEHEDYSIKGSVLLLDKEGKHLHYGVAPSLPDFYNEAVDGIEIGVGVGSCGTAAYLGKRVIVEDIQSHEYWRPYRQLARDAAVNACWSEPILSSRGSVLGTFAIYHATTKSPQPEDLERISFAANLASIAIENRNVHEELERRAYSDYLTSLANRRYFLEQAEKELERIKRHGGQLSLLMLDIDHFKKINDTYGHKVGDQVLQHLAKVCSQTLRDIDIIGRIGGEEFAVLLPETDSSQSVQTAERMRSAIDSANLIPEQGVALHFTASFGVATLNQSDNNIDKLLIKADKALYLAKKNGRNLVCSSTQLDQ